ncbi:hypothetical protein SNEBB_002255 [Seison nebaliae]|nr:hypothetical protein SNEBB_002255 [Seison nebaliae]
MGKVTKKSKVPLTDEERVQQMQKKLQLEKDVQRNKENLLREFLKEKLEKEEKFTGFNQHKLTQQWRSIMREAKTKELQKDIQILSQTFERILDRKDSVISLLTREIEEAEEQFEMVVGSHRCMLDTIETNHTSRLDLYGKHYESSVYNLLKDFDSYHRRMTNEHNSRMEQLQQINYAMDQQQYEYNEEERANIYALKDEIRTRNLEAKNQLKLQLESQIEQLWNQFHVVTKNYQDATEGRKKTFEELGAKDEKSAKKIEMQSEKLKKLFEQINGYKSKLLLNSKEAESLQTLFRENKDLMSTQFHELKQQMKWSECLMSERLKEVAVSSSTAYNVLEKFLDIGRSILKLAEMARKNEMESEKLLPFYNESLTANELAGVKEHRLRKTSSLSNMYNANDEMMESFWKRYNHVELHVLTEREERHRLTDENRRLKLFLKQYLDGVSVTSETINEANSLLLVNKCNLKTNLHRQRRSLTASNSGGRLQRELVQTMANYQ